VIDRQQLVGDAKAATACQSAAAHTVDDVQWI